MKVCEGGQAKRVHGVTCIQPRYMFLFGCIAHYHTTHPISADFLKFLFLIRDRDFQHVPKGFNTPTFCKRSIHPFQPRCVAEDTHVFRYALQLGWAPSEKQRASHNKATAAAYQLESWTNLVQTWNNHDSV